MGQLVSAADVVQLPSPRSYAALIDKALSLEPNNVSARFLAAIDQPAAGALSSLRQLDREISPTDPLSDAIDEQILWLVVGEQLIMHWQRDTRNCIANGRGIFRQRRWTSAIYSNGEAAGKSCCSMTVDRSPDLEGF